MLVTDAYIFLELHKTGCTHTRNILMAIPSVGGERLGNHDAYHSLTKTQREEIGFQEKKKLGNIRNPWSWYVSLWAFGCMQKGGLYHKLTNPKAYPLKHQLKYPRLITKGPSYWKRLYSDPYNTANFRTWLTELLTQPSSRVTDGFYQFPLSKEVGLLSFRMLRLYTPHTGAKLRELTSFEEVAHFYKKHNYMHDIIKNEEIANYFLTHSEDFGSNPQEIQQILNTFKQRSNASHHKEYTNYYDEGTKALVASKERLVIQLFDYTFEGTNAASHGSHP